MSIIDISALPRSVQKRPEVRALSMRVYPGEGPRHWRVAGEHDIYDVYYFGDSFHCGCKAGSSGRICAHAIRAKQAREHQENT